MENPKIREKKTLHPFIITSKEICNGSPVIKGTRTRVIDIAIEYDRIGYTPDQIVDAHPHLDLVKVHDALSYYYENRERLGWHLEMGRVKINKAAIFTHDDDFLKLAIKWSEEDKEH